MPARKRIFDPAQKRISEFFAPIDSNTANNSSQMINSCDEPEIESPNKKQKPNSADGAGHRVPLQAISESTLNVETNRTVITTRRVTRSSNRTDTEATPVLNQTSLTATKPVIETDTEAMPVSNQTSITAAKRVPRSSNRTDREAPPVSNQTSVRAGRRVSSLFSLFKEKSKKPQTEVPDTEDESEQAGPSKPQAIVPDSDDEWDEVLVHDTEPIGTSKVGVKPLLSNKHQIDDSDAESDGIDASALIVDDEYIPAENDSEVNEDVAALDGADMVIDEDEYVPSEDGSDDDDATLDGANVFIDENDYIPFEEESEDEDEDADADAEVSSDSNEASEPPLKSRRLGATELDGAAVLETLNASQEVSEDDSDVQRFRHNLTVLIKTLCEWAAENSPDIWYRLPPELKEISAMFRALFARAAADPERLVKICLDGIPLQVQKLLGKEDLEEIDLLDLPLVPLGCKDRLVYIDIVTRILKDQIRQERRWGGRLFKVAKCSSDLKDALDVKLYVGSSVGKKGGYARTQKHECVANGHVKAESGLHHAEIMKPDVLCNVRLVGVWQNPFADGRSHVDQDLARWVPPMVEGLIVAYLGLYTEANKSASLPLLFTDASYALIRRIRSGVPLPDFGSSSLNRAWPLMQGTRSGIFLVSKCANPECLRPRTGSKEVVPVGIKTANRLLRLDTVDLLAPYYCEGCCGHYRKFGKIRTREGLSTGRWRHEMDAKSINQAWFNDHGRKCRNEHCGVSIDPKADVYGIENGIRCLRCYKYALIFKKEYSPMDNGAENHGNCEICPRQAVPIISWTKIERNDPNLPTELCEDCYSTRCSFLQDVRCKGQSKTYPICANPACWDHSRAVLAETRGTFIENTKEHLWRCVRCDYCHEIGIDELTILEDAPKPPPGPIASHRFNSTKCVDCEMYISSQEWEKVENGYRCGSCIGVRCSYCNSDPVLMRVSWRTVNGQSQLRCKLCKRQKGTADEHGPVKRKPRVTPDRKCCNENCSNNRSNYDRWHFDPAHPGDVSRVRCARCFVFLKRNGKDWCPDNVCYNESCDSSGPDVKWKGGADGKTRCIACHNSWINTGVERPCKATCHNYDYCGHDYTNYTKSFTVDVKGDGHVRCNGCYTAWKGYNGRQFEVGAKLPPGEKTKDKKCSRPGCHAEGRQQGAWHRWFEFKPAGWVCHPCFKELVAIQNGKAPAEEVDGDQQSAITPSNESRPDASGGVGPTTGSH